MRVCLDVSFMRPGRSAPTTARWSRSPAIYASRTANNRPCRSRRGRVGRSINSLRSMDKLRITGLTLSALIGERAWERHVRQTIRIDLEFDTDASRAAATDDLAQAIDYGSVARRVADLV